MTSSTITLFQGHTVRRTWNDEQWYFVLEDVVFVLTESVNPKDYINKMKKRDLALKEGWGQIVHTLGVQTSGGMQKMNCVATEGALRIIQSIPSPKAEPFKRWLAKVGYERMQEIQDPELAQARMKSLYEAKGYSKDWIDKRLRGIAIRQNLTDEWKERGVTSQSDYAILTSEISKATFGMTPSEYKEYKGLSKKGDNLRDHMTDFELIFTMLGEKVTTEISHKEQPNTMNGHKKVARRGGTAAQIARQATEKEIGHSVVSSDNYTKIQRLS